MMRTILWMNPATMVRIILLRWRTLWNLLQMSNEKNLNTEFRTLWNLNIGFNSSILRLNECVLFTSGETCMRNFFQKII